MDPTEEVEIRRDQMEGKMFIVAREKQQQQQSQCDSKHFMTPGLKNISSSFPW